jgi:hypothetical protein
LSYFVLSCLVFSDTIKFHLCDLLGPAHIVDAHPEKLGVGVKVRVRTRGRELGLELGWELRIGIVFGLMLGLG